MGDMNTKILQKTNGVAEERVGIVGGCNLEVAGDEGAARGRGQNL